MLTHLHISNLAIIDRLDVSFAHGLSVLTGETGAGKSIILGAVGLLMGDRASFDSVRNGADEAEVEGLFLLDRAGELSSIFEDNSIPFQGELILRRVLTSAGRSRCYVNNRLVNLSVLAEIGSRLLAVSGQHESQRLLKENLHLYLLDSYAGLENDRHVVAESFNRLTRIRTDLNTLRQKKDNVEQRSELLSFQLDELERAGLRPGEFDELQTESDRLKNAARLSGGAEEIHEALYGQDGSVSDIIGQSAAELARLAGLDDTLTPVLETLKSAGYAVEEAARELSSYARDVVFDPARQTEVEERLDLIRRMIRKYSPGGRVEDVLDASEKMAEELLELKNADVRLDELTVREKKAAAELDALAARLTEKRIAAAEQMDLAVERELAELCLEGSSFRAAVQPAEAGLGPDGADTVAFNISANPGEPVRPLSKIASGGELSRVTLALKSILAKKDEIETVIFDEVDAGIGGRVAEVVGRKLKSLAGSHQVFCITHLPQIAAHGGNHYKVTKSVRDGRTVSGIGLLDNDQRIEEVARMLAGVKMTEEALANARRMIKSAA